MRNLFDRFFREYQFQLKLSVGHWSYWAMHGVFAVILVALWGSRTDRPAEGMLVLTWGSIATGLTMLVTVLLSGISASRASREHFVEMAQTFPIGPEILLAGILASCTAGLGLLVEPIILAAFVGPFQSVLDGISPFCWYMLVGSLFGAAFTWWLSSWLKFRRWVYPLLAAAWAGFWLGPTFLSRFEIYGLQIFDLLNRMRGVDYDSLFGRLEEPAMAIWFCLFYVALAMLFFSLAQWNFWRQRFNRKVVPGIFFTGLAVALSAFFAFQFYSALSHVQAQADERLDLYTINNSAVLGDERIVSYDVQLDMTAEPEPVIEASLVIRNDSHKDMDTVNLVLNHQFKVKSAGVPFKQTGDIVSLQLAEKLIPGGELAVHLVYHGELKVYQVYTDIPVKQEFLNKDNARLGLASFWLPVAGSQNLEKIFGENELAIPASFRLSVKTRPETKVFCNLNEEEPGVYRSADVSWLYWVASPRLVSKPVGDIQLFSSYADIGIAQTYAEQMDKFYRAMQNFFPQANSGKMSLLIFDATNGLPFSDWMITGNHPMIMSSRILLSYADVAPRMGTGSGSEVLRDFYQLMGGTSLSGNDLNSAGYFLWVYVQNDGNAEAIRAKIGSPNPLEAVLLDVVEQSGQEGLKLALETLRNAPDSQENDDTTPTAVWLKGAIRVH